MLSRIVLLALFASTGGCTSMRSTMLNRLENDAYVKNGIPTKGVPITVRVPTHLEIVVLEDVYFIDKDPEEETIDIQILPFEHCRGRNLRVKSDIIRGYKVMTVDFKRPAAGTLEYNLKFGTDAESGGLQEQYITQIETFLYDRTLQDTANLVAAVVPGVTPRQPGSDPTAGFAFSTSTHGSQPQSGTGFVFGDMMVKERVAAIQRFDLNACDFEARVADFLQLHLNACHNCSGFTEPFFGDQTETTVLPAH